MNLKSRALVVDNGVLRILDQQRLPWQENWICIESPQLMAEAIRALKVRGAPLIGVAAALSLSLWTQNERPTKESFFAMAEFLRETRPTAVNLMNAMDRMKAAVSTSENIAEDSIRAAQIIFSEDVELCRQMAKTTAELIEDGDSLLTHCNTGGLATVGVGTALGGILYAHEQKKKIHVYVDETRPLLQGGRLTTWELAKAQIPFTLICDSMAAFLMSQKKIDKIFVGSDRIAANGDFANKIGTYSLAVAAHYHNVPFYVVAPRTTLDLKCISGAFIPIEQRGAKEVQGVEMGAENSIQWCQSGAVYNPSFDVTPVDLLSGIVLDGTYYSREKIKNGSFK